MHKSTLITAVVFSILGATCSIAFADETPLEIGYFGFDAAEPVTGESYNFIGLGVGIKNEHDTAISGGFFMGATSRVLSHSNYAPHQPNILVGIGLEASTPSYGIQIGFGARWTNAAEVSTAFDADATHKTQQFARADVTLRF
jgi:hypothetical protein